MAFMYNYYQDPMTIMKGTTSDTSYRTLGLLRVEFLYVNIWFNLVQFPLYEFVNFLLGHFLDVQISYVKRCTKRNEYKIKPNYSFSEWPPCARASTILWHPQPYTQSLLK